MYETKIVRDKLTCRKYRGGSVQKCTVTNNRMTTVINMYQYRKKGNEERKKEI